MEDFSSRRQSHLATLTAEVLDKKAREGRAETSLTKVAWLFGLALPDLGPRPIAAITAPEVLAELRQVETCRKLETAGRLRTVIGEVFRYAIATGRAENDPTFALRGALTSPKPKTRAAIVEPVPCSASLRSLMRYGAGRRLWRCGHEGAAYLSDVEHLLHLVAEVVDDLHADAP